MKKYILHNISMLLLALTFTSCNGWLDVKSETEAKEEDLFAKKNGFCNALTGLYMNIADNSAYGQALTMTVVEELAHNWYNDGYDYNPAYYYLCRHDYSISMAKDAIRPIYASLYNSVVKANIILKNLETNASCLDIYPQLKGCIEGETHAIKALCQFDLLRLFGQLPQGGTRKVRLPYSFTTSIDVMPAYYDFDDYVRLVFEDLDKAIDLLGKNDPVLKYTLSELSYPSRLIDFDEDYLMYRRTRLNYWAAKALRARINLYLGRTEAAYREALEVINARTESGEAVCTFNGQYDLENANYTLPTESLFSLSKFDVFSYTNGIFHGFATNLVTPNQHLVLSMQMFDELFKGVATNSNNRYLLLWNRRSTTNSSEVYPSLCKYYHDSSAGAASSVSQALVPMLRLSEMYLIAMETTPDLAEANTLYTAYMRDRNTLIEDDHFKSLGDVRSEVVNEYRREFIGEGHMFYVYKRLFAKKMMWLSDEVSEADYIVPVPDTEYEKTDAAL